MLHCYRAGAPANYTGAALTEIQIDMENVLELDVVIVTGAWAGGTAAVTLEQSVTAGGATAAVAFTKQYVDQVETAVSSNTFNLSAANKIHVIPVTADMLNVDSGYKYLNVAIATPGSNNDYYAACYVVRKSRY